MSKVNLSGARPDLTGYSTLNLNSSARDAELLLVVRGGAGGKQTIPRLAASDKHASTSAFDVGAHASAGKVGIGGADGVQHAAMLAYGYA
jgi:hypothetical protein